MNEKKIGGQKTKPIGKKIKRDSHKRKLQIEGPKARKEERQTCS